MSILDSLIKTNVSVENVLEQPPEICMDNVKQDESVLEYVEEQTPEICLVVKQNSHDVRMEDQPSKYGNNPKKGDTIEVYKKPSDPNEDFRNNPCEFIKLGTLRSVVYHRTHHAPVANFILDDGSCYTFGGYSGNSHNMCYNVIR
jgi:hypothetical protein